MRKEIKLLAGIYSLVGINSSRIRIRYTNLRRFKYLPQCTLCLHNWRCNLSSIFCYFIQKSLNRAHRISYTCSVRAQWEFCEKCVYYVAVAAAPHQWLLLLRGGSPGWALCCFLNTLGFFFVRVKCQKQIWKQCFLSKLWIENFQRLLSHFKLKFLGIVK